MRFSSVLAIVCCVGPLLASTAAEETPGVQTNVQTTEEAKAVGQAHEAEKTERTVNLAAIVAFLRPTDSVLEVGNMKMVWREFQPMMKAIVGGKPQEFTASPDFEKHLRGRFQALAMRGLFLQEMNDSQLTLTEPERAQYEAVVIKNLKEQKKPSTLAQYQRTLSPGKSSIARLNYEDTLRLMKLSELQRQKVAVTDKEVDEYINFRKQFNKVYIDQNEHTGKLVAGLLEDKSLQTDEGFAQMARKCSEGVESDRGGELDYDFTREELAELNQLDAFNYQPGETTGVLETATCFRIMRVLRIVPPKKEGEPERLRVAQLLFGKIFPEDLGNREDIRQMLQVAKLRRFMESEALRLSQKYPVTCIFFPDGLWPQKQQSPSPSQNASEKSATKPVEKNKKK